MSVIVTMRNSEEGKTIGEVELLAGGVWGVTPVSFANGSACMVAGFGFGDADENETIAAYRAAVRNIITSAKAVGKDAGSEGAKTVVRRSTAACTALVQELCDELGAEDAKKLLQLAADSIRTGES